MRPVPAEAVRESSRGSRFTWRWYDWIAVTLGFASAAVLPFSVFGWVLLATVALAAAARLVWGRTRSGPRPGR